MQVPSVSGLLPGAQCCPGHSAVLQQHVLVTPEGRSEACMSHLLHPLRHGRHRLPGRLGHDESRCSEHGGADTSWRSCFHCTNGQSWAGWARWQPLSNRPSSLLTVLHADSHGPSKVSASPLLDSLPTLISRLCDGDTLTRVRWHLPGTFRTPDSHSWHFLWENVYSHTHRAAFQLTTDAHTTAVPVATEKEVPVTQRHCGRWNAVAQRLLKPPRRAGMWVWVMVTTGSS